VAGGSEANGLTGGSGALGRATAARFRAEGLISGRDAARLAAAAKRPERSRSPATPPTRGR